MTLVEKKRAAAADYKREPYAKSGPWTADDYEIVLHNMLRWLGAHKCRGSKKDGHCNSCRPTMAAVGLLRSEGVKLFSEYEN